jgi:hypothetical protein
MASAIKRVPNAPTIGTAIAGNASASVAFSNLNYVTNPSFEGAATTGFAAASATLTASSTYAYVGTFSMASTLLSASDTNIAYWGGGTVPSAGNYNFSAWFYIPGASTIPNGSTISISYEGANGSNVTSNAAVLQKGNWIQATAILNFTTTTYGAIVARSNFLPSTYAGQIVYSDLWSVDTAAAGSGAVYSYTATSSPGGITGSGMATPVTVSGLTNGTAYTFTVKATNVYGTSVASSASNSITPVASAPSTVTYLVVAGGGGATGNFGGGGGAGGYSTGTLSVSTSVGYTVTVGAGGSGPFDNATTSIFSSITSLRGAPGLGSTALGGNGTYGSAGGPGPGSYAGAAGTPGQGNNSGASDGTAGGGGGGAGAVGGSAASGSAGGNGSTFSVNGGTYAGGGGGAGTDSRTSNNGGSGGGGRGGSSASGRAAGVSGTANTGGGAGGGTQGNSATYYTNGGSGIVIVAYSSTFADAASTTGSPSFVNNGTNKIYTFTGSGSITF